ncbi:GDP-mannose mannosyl hydrolase [Sulfurovum riftiae]|uniref:GDP-mannose mannosyl hydrolase n=1 Tax=Sulfurovum riftiae TaxID=1630136 RepID=A0A151CHG9_9BACT|nr:NUDIX domain-containing protein [Sulfurovum riftiae]KYJ86982.1 GDP-mannose mannosyl hydrolase [Sulfurovum riftiae]
MLKHDVFIEETLFRDIIENTPLVSLDLVVRQGEKILLGKRLNKPAKGYWFTIGGRILKNEKLDHAMQRIAKDELGVQLNGTPRFIGVFEHLYDDSIYDGVSTHYINLVYETEIDDLPDLPRDQHDTYRWFTVGELLESEDVHRYIKEIFVRDKQMTRTGKGTV